MCEYKGKDMHTCGFPIYCSSIMSGISLSPGKVYSSLNHLPRSRSAQRFVQKGRKSKVAGLPHSGHLFFGMDSFVVMAFMPLSFLLAYLLAEYRHLWSFLLPAQWCVGLPLSMPL